MQEVTRHGLSKKPRPIPLLEAEQCSDEKLEDQLDRLTTSVQQVLAGARKLQLDDRELDFAGITTSGPPTSRFFRGNSMTLETESDDAGCKTPISDYEVVEDDSLEIIEYLVTVIEKTQMENEDLRSQALRSFHTQSEVLHHAEQSWITAIYRGLNLPPNNETATTDGLLAALERVLKPEIECTMEQLCKCEEALHRLLRDFRKDADVRLELGHREFGLRVVREQGDMLIVPKRRIAMGITEMGRNTEAPSSQDWEEWPQNEDISIVQCDDHDHWQCERDIDELHLRLRFIRDEVIPSEIYRHVEQEKATLKRLEITRKQEIEKIVSARQELEIITIRLRAETEEARSLKEALSLEQSSVNELKSKLSSERAVMSEKMKEIEMEKQKIETEKSSFVNFASMQGTEVLSLKEKIERMVGSRTQIPDDTQSIPESLPDGDLRDLDLRIKQMLSLLSSDNANIIYIQQEITDIENDISRLPPRRSGMRRVKLQINSAKNRILTIKSKQAIAGADRIMSNLSSTMQALEKNFTKGGPPAKGRISTPAKAEIEPKRPISPEKRVLVASRVSEPKGQSTPVRPGKDLQPSGPGDENDPCSRWLSLNETIRSQEAVIAKLRSQLNHIVHRIKNTEKREIRQSEREIQLRSVQKQLELMHDNLEKRGKLTAQREIGLKRREMVILAALDDDDRLSAARDMLIQVEDRVKQEETVINAKSKEVEEVKKEVEAGKVVVSAKEKHLAKVQRLLAKEHLRLEKEKKKLDSMRQDLSHLLPSLQTLSKPHS